MRTSSDARRSTSASRACRTRASIAPPRRWRASPRALSVLARTISFTASAWVSPIRPFRNARWVNSPGPAARNPERASRDRSRWITGRLPWQKISAPSSPV